MTMTPRVQKAAFLAHVAFSVGWMGAVAAYLALAGSGLRRTDAEVARSAYLSMELIGWTVIVPLSLATLLSGLVQSLGTEWGLFRHYWVTVKFLVAAVGSVILLTHMRAVGEMAGFARAMTLSAAEHGDLRISLVVHAVGGLLLLLAATALSIYKPWGLTPYGRKKMEHRPIEGTSSRGLYILLGVIGAVVLMLLLHHLAGGGMRHH
jgi:hypothetical protein